MNPDISSAGSKPRVFVIDDESEIPRFLRIGLEAYGYEVIEARSGESALRQAVTGAPEMSTAV